MAVTYTWKKYNTNQTVSSYSFAWRVVCGFTGLDWVNLEAALPCSKESTYVTYTTQNLGNLNEHPENYLSYNISSTGYFTGDVTFKSNVSTVTTNIYDWEDAFSYAYTGKELIQIVDSSQWVEEDSSTRYVPTTGKIYRVEAYSNDLFYLAEPSIEKNYTYSQGTYIGTVTSTSSSTYPTNGRSSSDGYWYVYEGSDNVAPTTPGIPSLPSEIKAGTSILVSWTAASDTNGNLSDYALEVSLSGGSWTQIYSGSATSATYTVPLGTETIAFRVKAYDSEGAESGYATTSTYVVSGASSIAGGSVVINNVWKALTGEGYVNVNGVWRPLVRSLSCIGAVWKESSSSASGSLPSGYTQVEYIESTGTQYIDTGIFANANTKMEADLAYTTYEAGYSGTYPSGSYFMFGTNTNHEVYLGSQVLTSFGKADTNRFQISIDAKNKSATVAGVTKTFSTTMNTSPLSLLIFAYRSSDSIAGYAKFKLYSYKLYDNNTLAYDFVPCVTTGGLVGLYDKINNKFYGNAGTGSFTAGAAI